MATGSLRVPAGVTLQIEPGVEVELAAGVTVVIQGALEASGTADSPIRFVRRVATEAWGGILVTGSAATAHLMHVEVAAASNAVNGASELPAAFNVRSGAEVELSSCWIHDSVAVSVDSTGGSSLTVRDTLIERTHEGIHSADSYALIENTTVRDVVGYSDSIDFDGDSTPQSVIRNCLLDGNAEDDGIDLASANALIEDVVIRGVATGKAISVDGVSSPTFRRVLIYDCLEGIVSKDSCSPIFEQCTVARCTTGVKCYEKTGGRGGGHGGGHSLIVWGNTTEVSLDAKSSFDMTFSIVKGGYPGAENLESDPLFVDFAAGDFRPLPGSPAIGTGKEGVTRGALEAASGESGFLRGDANRDLALDISDAVVVLLQLFTPLPMPCPDADDVDDSGDVSLTDAVVLLRFLFQAGAPPPAPYPSVGPDPTPEDPLGCEGL